MMTNTLKQHIQSLHLSGLLNSLQLRLQEAEANRLPYAQFLELLLQDEINVRHQRMLARQAKAPAEARQLGGAKLLVAEHQYRMLGKRPFNPGEARVVEAAQIHPDRFGAQRLPQWVQSRRTGH